MEAGSRWQGSHFCGVYRLNGGGDGLAQEFTPVRGSVEHVVADLASAQEARRSLLAAQIIDLETLEPIEPVATTMARLRRDAA
jgi:hypothetical protein